MQHIEYKARRAIFTFHAIGGERIACLILSPITRAVLFQTIIYKWETHFDGLYLRYATPFQLGETKALFTLMTENATR